MRIRFLLAIFVVLAACVAHGQQFAGQSGGTARVVPPYRFCLGPDDGTDACFIQNGKNMATMVGALTVTGGLIPGSYTVATLPLTAFPGAVVSVTDALTPGSCTVGGGTSLASCRWSGSAWQSLGGGALAPSLAFVSTNSGGAVVAASLPAGSVVAGNTSGVAVAQVKPAIDVRDKGSFADNTVHTIAAGDISAHTEWLGCGTVNTSGTGVTWVSGAKFLPQFATYSLPVNIAGTNYTVSAEGSTTGGVATTMTLTGSAGTQTGVRFCMYAAGDYWDYVALQETLLGAIGVPGLENPKPSSWSNVGITVPCGSYILNKPLIANRGVGLSMEAAGSRLCSVLTQTSNNMPLFIANGLAYSHFDSLQWICTGTSTTAPCIDIDWDNSGVNAKALQANTWRDNIFSGSANWAIGFRVGNSGYMGSEFLFLNDHFLNFTSRCYDQEDYNALQNTFIGGDFQNCQGDGIYVFAGSIQVFSGSFQDDVPFTATAQTGYDIHIINSADATNLVSGGTRTESGNFMKCGAGNCVIDGALQNPGYSLWAANTACSSFNNKIVIPPTTSTQYIGGTFRTSSSTGNTGGSEPTWNYTTVTDGSCSWTYTQTTFVECDSMCTVENSESDTGTVLSKNNDYAIRTFRNNTFSHQDWLQVQASPGANPFSNYYNAIVENNSVRPGGGSNSGGAGVNYSPANNGVKAITGYPTAHYSQTPMIFAPGLGAAGYETGVGASQDMNDTGTDTADAILAVISPSGKTAAFGRRSVFGTNVAGENQVFACGKGTGNAAACSILFQASVPTTTGATRQALAQVAALDATGFTFSSGKGQHIKTQAAASDIAGTCSAGSGTTCAITFTTNYASTPSCIVTPTFAATQFYLSAQANSGFTITYAPSGASTFNYQCEGNPN